MTIDDFCTLNDFWHNRMEAAKRAGDVQAYQVAAMGWSMVYAYYTRSYTADALRRDPAPLDINSREGPS